MIYSSLSSWRLGSLGSGEAEDEAEEEEDEDEDGAGAGAVSDFLPRFFGGGGDWAGAAGLDAAVAAAVDLSRFRFLLDAAELEAAAD